MSAVDTVESEVRELVRRRGLDPVSDRVAVRRLVDEVVTDDDDERALSSSLPPLADPTLAARAGEGRWLDADHLLAGPETGLAAWGSAHLRAEIIERGDTGAVR